jgi:hypothetical protein
LGCWARTESLNMTNEYDDAYIEVVGSRTVVSNWLVGIQLYVHCQATSRKIASCAYHYRVPLSYKNLYGVNCVRLVIDSVDLDDC